MKSFIRKLEPDIKQIAGDLMFKNHICPQKECINTTKSGEK